MRVLVAIACNFNCHNLLSFSSSHRWTLLKLSCCDLFVSPSIHPNALPALWILPGTTRVNQYQKEHSLTHTYHGHQSSFICFLHLLQSMASPLLNLHAWQSFCTISDQVFNGLPPGMAHHFILHTFLHPIIVFFLQHMPSQPVSLKY